MEVTMRVTNLKTPGKASCFMHSFKNFASKGSVEITRSQRGAVELKAKGGDEIQ